MSDQISFYNGTSIDEDQFFAAASFDALEAPDEPSGVFVLFTFSISVGWSQPRIIQGSRISDMIAKAIGESAAIALTEDGDVFGSSVESLLFTVEDLKGISTRALSRTADRLFVIGDSGHYFEQSDELEFNIMTSDFISQRPAWEATREEKRAYFRSQTHIMNAEASPDGRIAMTEISKVMFLETDLTMTEVTQPRIFVGVTHDPESRQFWFCGHSPNPIVGRETSRGVIETVFFGAPNSHTFTDLAIYNEEIYLADTDLSSGGLFVLTPEETETNFEFNKVELPEIFGDLPVWKVDAIDGVLWVLRPKDLLRFDGEEWKRFPIPQVAMPNEE